MKKMNIREARKRFSEIVNAVATRKEKIILFSRNKPRAAIVSLDDLRLLEMHNVKKNIEFFHLKELKKIRDTLRHRKKHFDSLKTLKKLRNERERKLTGGD